MRKILKFQKKIQRTNDHQIEENILNLIEEIEIF